ncbi:MAG: peptide ABC transporter substrate-binding protein [Rhizobiales bacterium]|nr:peptide ABC transporter substrate-binding protein [Hyphomicrobiales bacterium]
MSNLSRRSLLQLAGLSTLAAGSDFALFGEAAKSAPGDVLTIAYPAAPAAFDPNTGPQTTSPGNQSIFRTIYDPYITQNPDLTLSPGVIEKFGWNDDKSKISLTLRAGVKWHDGETVTIDDVLWNLKRLTDPKAPLAPIFASNKNFVVNGNTITFDVSPWRANMLERLTFLGCYLLPKKYYEKVGAEGFEKKPIGTGPYMFDTYERGSFLRLKKFSDYWGPRPEFETVVFKFVTDPPSRVAELERGSADATADVPYEEYERLKSRGLAGSCYPIADVALIFVNNEGAFADENVRRAAVFAIDKKAIVERLLRGYAKPLGTLLAPEYKGFDPSIYTPFDPAKAGELLAKSGYSPSKPVELTIQTTKGYKPKDYEIVQAIVQMWRKVGIHANIEVYEIAKHFELRAQHKLAPAAFYDWGNSTADPESSLGTAMISASAHSSWKGGQLDDALKAAFVQKDEEKRLAQYKAIDQTVSDNAYIIPLFQYYQPVVYKPTLKFTPHVAGYVMPSLFSMA